MGRTMHYEIHRCKVGHLLLSPPVCDGITEEIPMSLFYRKDDHANSWQRRNGQKCALVFAVGTWSQFWEPVTQAHHASRMQEACVLIGPWSLLWLIAEESLIRVAECIKRMFILRLGNDPAYDLSGHFRRNEEWSIPCIWAGSWFTEEGATSVGHPALCFFLNWRLLGLAD